MNLYFFTFDIDDSPSDVIKQLQQMGNTCSCLSNGWFIRTDKGEDELYDAIQPLFNNGKGRFILTPIDLSKMNGWISINTTRWLKENDK